MTDEELIARLRSMHWCVTTEENGVGVSDKKVAPEAAARIEQLKHRLFQCATDLQIYMDAFAVSEAKLAKAVEGLERIAGAADREWTTARCGGLCDIACATLAEISSEAALNKGESHE